MSTSFPGPFLLSKWRVGRRNPKLPKYSKSRGEFCHVTYDEMTVFRRLFPAICSRVCFLVIISSCFTRQNTPGPFGVLWWPCPRLSPPVFERREGPGAEAGFEWLHPLLTVHLILIYSCNCIIYWKISTIYQNMNHSV